jgi:hypothetical protein
MLRRFPFKSTAAKWSIGVDFTFNDLFSVTKDGLLVSTDSGAGQRFYDISLDFTGATNVDFFSINPGSYLPSNGTFAVAAVPEPRHGR